MAKGKCKSHPNKFKDYFDGINEEFENLLGKSDNGASTEKLSDDEREKFWSSLNGIINMHLQNEGQESVKIVNNLCELILHILNNNSFELDFESHLLKTIENIACNAISLQDNSLRNKLSLVCEQWMIKKCESIPNGVEYFTLKYLLEICCKDKPLVSNIQRLNSIRRLITAGPFETNVPSLRPLLIKLVQNQIVLNSEHGQRVIAHLLILSQRIMLDVHKTLLLELGSCAKKQATLYGKIYVIAWQNAGNEMRIHLEKSCYKHLMESFLKEQRTSIELTKVGQNLLSILDVWHAERTKKNNDFVTMITDCYRPFLWKYLESSFTVHRVNAVDVLFRAFPLQRPGDNVMDSERLFNQQFDSMVLALRDDCHIVRIIAVREVCNILSVYWNSFSPVQIQKLLTIISKEDAHDASSADVRRMVYVGFQSFLNNPLAMDYLKQILPSMADNIHDVNQKVRTAFVNLLIAVKEKGDPNLKYSDLVPSFSLYYRLAEENIKIGVLIVKLLMSSYYQEDMPVIEWMKRFIFLVKTYPMSYRNFFMYSEKVLPFPSAFAIIRGILVQIGAYVMSKLEADNVNMENEEECDTESKKKRPQKRKRPLGSVNGDNKREKQVAEKKTETTKARECAFDDPKVVQGLFDIVTILWVVHDNNLQKPENDDKRLQLYETYINYAQPFINYYKDSGLFMSVLCLSGNIPSSLLRSNSITLPGYCMKMLKSNKVIPTTDPDESTLTMLVALIKWGKGGDVLEQVMLWLEAAFETQDTEDTILPIRRVKISETIQPNSLVAINILNTLMKIEYVKVCILKKNYAQLYELWKYMTRIKKLVETRLEMGEPFDDELVSDTFIKLCFKRYVKFIPLLKDKKDVGEEENDGEDNRLTNTSKGEEDVKKDEGNDLIVNYQAEIEGLIQWAEDVLYPLLEDGQPKIVEGEDISLVTSVYNDILFVADNMLILHVVNRQFYVKISHLILKLLRTKYSIYFVKAASRIAAAISYSGRVLFKVNDDLKIFSNIVPCIVSHVLDSLKMGKPDEDDWISHADLAELKTNFDKILETYQDNFKSKATSRETVRQLQTLIGIFLDALVFMMSKEIETVESWSKLPVYTSLSQFPPEIAIVVSFFYNRKFWGSMFVHVLNAVLAAGMYDSRSILSSIVLLNFYAVSDKKTNKVELRKAISTASCQLKKARDEALKAKESHGEELSSTKMTSFTGLNLESGRPSASSVVAEPNTSICPRRSDLCFNKLIPLEVINDGLNMLSEMEAIVLEKAEDIE